MLKPKATARKPAPALPTGPGAAATPNDQALSVGALAAALKRTVEDRFGYVRVRGEISNFRGQHSSGHAYFSLKDDQARIDAVIWKPAFARLRVKPEEGMDVIASGRLTTFPGKSSYQIVIDDLEPAGIGALMAALEDRRRRLAAEGLFDAARKRPLPFMPAVIGVVTSPTGAVIRDILHRIAGRCATRVVVWPVRVQGETSAAEVTRAVLGFNALTAAIGVPEPQLLIIARGGGSLEDLWGFNDEALVRAAAASRIPLISAVGHETDWTLLDHAADLRAPTPTGAAELAVPVLLDLALALDGAGLRLAGAARRGLDERRRALAGLGRLLPSGISLLAQPRQRLDFTAMRLPEALRATVAARRLGVTRLAGRLGAQAPRARLKRLDLELGSLAARLAQSERVLADQRRRRLDTLAARLAAGLAARLRLASASQAASGRQLASLDARLHRAVAATLDARRSRLLALGQLLATLSYRSVLARGFALVRDGADLPVHRAAAVAPGAALTLEFADGRRSVVVDEQTPRPRQRAARALEGKPAGKQQGSLF